ncbi:hypothetical protein AQUCO_01600318v1 [Aquilegia coerulea]|uniref:Cytochrome P450 n=1 Tax=Aquilegia coerulea TaxID=218851 RepID=A0A2G5DR23_AQUCA|nr:hypothetical protein AQUCO_01600318v1 [Aquilegia coerulea]
MDSLHQCLGGILGLLIFFLCYLKWKKTTNINCKSAPEPKGAWPMVGHLPMLMGPQILHTALGALADEYGPVFTIRLGVHKTLVVSSWEIAKECFTINDKVLATRPSSVAVRVMGYNYASFAFAPYGSYWREARKIAILELLSNHRLELLKHVRFSEVSTSIKELYQVWQENCSNSNGFVPAEMKQWFGDLSINVVVRMVAGKRYMGASAKSDDEGRRFQKAIKEFFYYIGLFIVSDALPFLGWLDIQGHEKAMKKTAKELDCILEGWLKEHRQSLLDNGTEVQQDFMYVLLSILEDKKIFGYEADMANKGATDTTTITLTWALSLLLNNQHTLKKAQEEIDTIVGKDRQVNELDIEKLVYLQAIVKETLRLYPAAPLSAQHEAMEDCTVAGYHVPAGTRLITNLWKIQQDPHIWSNPSEFKPERFLTTQANVDVRGQHFEYIPFGSGRRSCPGISFGLQVIHLTLARLLQSFDFKTSLDALVDMTESPGLTNIKATPLDVLITPRLPADLY